MAGFIPAIHVFLPQLNKTWMPGTGPGMMKVVVPANHTCCPPLMWISAPFTYDDVSVQST